jgi:hypothetical protein
MAAKVSSLAALVLMPAMLWPQARSGGLVGKIVSLDTGEPLPYSIVSITALSRALFTSDSGAFVVRDLPAGALQLSVRRLGYTPTDLTVKIRAGATDTLLIQLPRIAVLLRAVTVRSYPPCTTPGAPSAQDDSILAAVFSQLRMNAEQYRLLSEQYPFTYELETTYSRKLRRDSSIVLDFTERDRVESKSRERYRPGGLIVRRRKEYFFNIPTLIDFADSSFLASHCFHYGGIEALEDTDAVRVDLVVADRLRDPDVNGSIYLDTRSFQILRTVLRLSKPVPQLGSVSEFEAITDFREVLPSIPVLSHVWSTTTIDPKAKRNYDEAYVEKRLLKMEFVRNKPGQAQGKLP